MDWTIEQMRLVYNNPPYVIKIITILSTSQEQICKVRQPSVWDSNPWALHESWMSKTKCQQTHQRFLYADWIGLYTAQKTLPAT